jgi:hypothetical protein
VTIPWMRAVRCTIAVANDITIYLSVPTKIKLPISPPVMLAVPWRRNRMEIRLDRLLIILFVCVGAM